MVHTAHFCTRESDFERIDASEARRITEKSEFLLKDCYRRIRQIASENNNRLMLDYTLYDGTLVQSVTQQLEKDGYNVEKDEFHNRYLITW